MKVTRPAFLQQRPAETSGVAAAVGLLIAKAAGVDDPDTIVALGIVVGFVPAAVTWLVTRFGWYQ